MSGFYRVHLRTTDDDWLTVYLSLTAEGLPDGMVRQPWLLKCKWGEDEVYGELQTTPSGYHRIVWSGDEHADSLTDFGQTPVRVGGTCKIHDHDDEETGDWWNFTIASVERL